MALQSTVMPHITNVVVWDIPSAVVAGERFRMKVGIKCSQGSNACQLTDGDFGIYDHHGAQAAAGTLPGGHWPGTASLYVAEVELQAPAAEGLYTWSAQFPPSDASDAGVPHAAGSASFGVRVVSPPQCLVTVETFDRVSHTPLRSARVVIPPYRAVTDARGVAQLRVAKGAYKLFVSQAGYLTFGLTVEVTADITATAELDLEPARERN